MGQHEYRLKVDASSKGDLVAMQAVPTAGQAV